MFHLEKKGTQKKDLWKKSASNSLQQIKSELTANLKRPMEIGKQKTTFDLILLQVLKVKFLNVPSQLKW